MLNEDGLGESIIIGRNAVIEAFRAKVSIDKVFIIKGDTDAVLRHIASTAREAGAVVSEVDKRKLNTLCSSRYGRLANGKKADGRKTSESKPEDSERYSNAHQGVVAVAAYAEYATVDDMLDKARQNEQQPLIVVCDEISDPHNLGAIIRTCEAAGAHGVIIPKRRSAGLSATVAKASSGAVFHIPVARVPNITAALRDLKKAGLWVFGATADGDTIFWESDFTGATAIVIGSEGTGISRLVAENCDYKVRIPMAGKLSSLNASVSASILLFEAVRQRG